MIGSTRAIRVWARAAPTDLRLGFYGLYELVRTQLGKDPLSGDCYLFVNSRRTSAKVLLWDGTGLCVYFKRLEVGKFAKLWGGVGGQPLKLTQSELALFLEGTKLAGKLPLSPREMSFEA